MIQGLCPPIPTPFVEGEVSTARLSENLTRWNELPFDGYVVLGSNGEAPLLDDVERKEILKTARASIPAGRVMIAGTGRESTRATIRSTREAFDLGADAVLVGVPTYFRPAMTHTALREHFIKVADASPGPMLLYSVPFFTNLPIGLELFGDLLKHERVAGIKDSSGDVDSLKGMLQAARGSSREACVMIGSARVLAAGLQLGAAGAVLAVGCVAAGACAEIARLSAAGRVVQAQEGSDRLAPLATAVTTRHGIGGLKAALDILGFYGGDPRPPLRPVEAAARAEIAELMKGLGLIA